MMFIIAIEYKALTLLFNKNEESTQKVLQTYETTLLLKGLITPKVNDNKRDSVADLNERLRTLHHLLNDYPEQKKQLQDIEDLIHKKGQLFQSPNSIVQQKDRKLLQDEIVRRVTTMIEEEKKLLKARIEVNSSNKIWLEFFIYGCITLGYLALFFLILVMTRFIFRLQRVQKELRKSEERLNLALSGSRIVIWDWTAETNKIYYSHELLTLLGYKGREIGHDLTDLKKLLHPDDVDVVMAAIQNHARQKVPYDIEYRLKHKDGHYHWFHSNGQGLWGPEGRMIQMSGFITDIHQHKEIERLKDEFIANVSHELRTPLTSIRGSLSLISLGSTDQLTNRTKELIDIAQKNTERLILLISDILDLEKLASGKMQFQFEDVPINDLVQKSVEARLKFAEKHQITIKTRYLEQDAKIHVDKERFIQVMDNLLSNAIKFSYAGGVVDIILSRHKVFVRIAIIDRGSGIPKDFRSKIFHKFTQADTSSTKQKSGTGLGLPLTKQIVDHMNGKITFKSQVNKGTTFYLDIPELMSA